MKKAPHKALSFSYNPSVYKMTGFLGSDTLRSRGLSEDSVALRRSFICFSASAPKLAGLAAILEHVLAKGLSEEPKVNPEAKLSSP